MCGICGIYNFDQKKVNISEIQAMNAKMILRGPDSEGSYINNNFGFGMRRLSIIDLANGNQPIFSEDKTKAIIFNGEIYNYIELRNELIKLGYNFTTSSDTEVILKLYEREGENFLEKLRGMFSICIYDSLKNKIIITRDRFGIKPLYYFINDKKIIFASDLNVFKACQISLNLSDDNFALFSLFSFFPSDKTVYKNIFKLLPGYKIIIENNKVKKQKYWVQNISQKKILSYDQLINLTEKNLKESTYINLRSDVKLGLLLSSGIDSSILGYLISKKIQNLNTLSINYTGKKDNEADDAKKFSSFINSNHYSYTMEVNSFFSYFDEIFSQIDEPNGDTALISSYLLAKKAKKLNIKVLISGAGADEIFGGYSRFFTNFNNSLFGALQKLEKFDFLNKIIPYKFRNLLYKLTNSKIALASNYSGQNFGVLIDFISKCKKDFLVSSLEKIIVDYKNSFYGFDSKKVMINDLNNYLPNNILSAFDKATMLNSVEGRVPYLDHNLSNIVFENFLGKEYFSKFYENKKLLRNIYNNKLPSYIFNKKKIGFNAPIEKWHNLNKEYFKNNKINEFVGKNIQLKKLQENINDKNLIQLIYTLNCYNKWANS